MKLVLVFVFTSILFLSKNKVLHHLAIVIYSLLFASRTDAIPDAIPYRRMFEGVNYSVEPVYLAFCDFFRSLGFSFHLYLFVLSIILIELVYHSTKKLFKNENIGLLFIILMSYYGILYYGVVLRASIAITLFYVGIVYLINHKNAKGVIIYYAFVALSMSFHNSALLYVLVPVFFLPINKKILYGVVALAFVLLLFNDIIPIQQYLGIVVEETGYSRFMNYVERDLETDRVNLLYFLYIIVAFIGVYVKDKVICKTQMEKALYNFFLNMYVFAVLLNSALWQIPSMTRLPQLWMFFEFVLVFMIIFRNAFSFSQQNKYICVCLYSGIKFFALIHYVPLLLNY